MGRRVLSRGTLEDSCVHRGLICTTWCMCRGEVKGKAGMTGWLRIMDLVGNLNETKSSLFE